MIDAHHHFWKYNPQDYVWMTGDMDNLRRDFLPVHLHPLMQENGIDAVVSVQARQMLNETVWLLQIADATDWVRGVIGWVPLSDSGIAQVLEQFAGFTKLKGMRHVLHDEPDDNYMLRPDFNAGIALLKDYGLTYDILIFERHLPQTLELVGRHPHQVFIVDHIAKPRIKDRMLDPWRCLIQDLAAHENVYCKVSGMATEAVWNSWTYEDLQPYFDAVLAAFGPKRLMFGSDWPVVTLASDYGRWAAAFRRSISSLSPDERRWICERTAVTAYCL